MVTSAKDVVASGVTGVVDLARRGRRWSVELKRSVSHAMDVVLGKSEELVDHFLPMTEEELGEARVLPLPHASGPGTLSGVKIREVCVGPRLHSTVAGNSACFQMCQFILYICTKNPSLWLVLKSKTQAKQCLFSWSPKSQDSRFTSCLLDLCFGLVFLRQGLTM